MKNETIQCIDESFQVKPGWRMMQFTLQMNRFRACQIVLWGVSKKN